MWNTVQWACGIILIALSVFLLYATGALLLRGEWQQFVITFLLWLATIVAFFILSLMEA